MRLNRWEVIVHICHYYESFHKQDFLLDCFYFSTQVPDDNTETLQIYDTNTGEFLFITGDKSVMELVKSQQVALESAEGEFGLDRIREMLLAADKQETVENLNEEGQPILVEEEEELMPSKAKTEEVISGDKQEEDKKIRIANVISLTDIAEI